LRKRIQVAGALFFLYVLLNGVERFIIEFIRVNPRYELFGITLSQAQYIALGLVAIGAGGLVYLYRKERK
jgi:phosphatidylglycerol---prolipoprotein diacylglyceryl transferase